MFTFWVGGKVCCIGLIHSTPKLFFASAGGIHRRLRLAWESHYPGDIRAIHNKVLESYQLKTLDGKCDIHSLRLNTQFNGK